jgi:hypothetical protein
MKKILSIVLVFCTIISLLILTPLQAQAANALEMSTGGSISKVTYSQNNSIEEIRIYSSSTKILKQDLMPPEGSAKKTIDYVLKLIMLMYQSLFILI